MRMKKPEEGKPLRAPPSMSGITYTTGYVLFGIHDRIKALGGLAYKAVRQRRADDETSAVSMIKATTCR
jgi:hypothetical protein